MQKNKLSLMTTFIGCFLANSLSFAGVLSEETLIEKYYDQLVDHAHPKQGTFKQRYYTDETLSTTNNAPVFYYICGEYNCTKGHVLGRGAIEALVTKFHGKLVVLEHRYYGKSLPTKDFSTENLKYLSTEAALQDLARFQQDISSTNHWTGKWIALGASYPGNLAAYYRMKYPHLVAGALASSAPVMAKEEFEEYDAHLAKVLPPNCTNRVRRAVAEVESKLHDQTFMNDLKVKLNASEVTDEIDFLDLLAEVVASAVQGKQYEGFCRELLQGNNDLEGFVRGAQYIFKTFDIKPVSLVAQSALSIDPKFYENDPSAGTRQWFYQSCTEYGYWQVANKDRTKSTRSALVDLNYHHNLCKRLFGLTTRANTDYINETYYKPLLDEKTSNIFFTNGENDPWSTLSLIAENQNTTNKNLSYYVIKGGAHHDDTNTPKKEDSAEVKFAREKLVSLVTEWLK